MFTGRSSVSMAFNDKNEPSWGPQTVFNLAIRLVIPRLKCQSSLQTGQLGARNYRTGLERPAS